MVSPAIEPESVPSAEWIGWSSIVSSRSLYTPVACGLRASETGSRCCACGNARTTASKPLAARSVTAHSSAPCTQFPAILPFGNTLTDVTRAAGASWKTPAAAQVP